MKKILIVWEIIPEQTDVYSLWVNEKDIEWMSKCHRRYINLTNTDDVDLPLNRLQEFLKDKEKVIDGNGRPIDIKNELKATPDLLIITGFVL